ncbi:MAG: hypothetical protein JOZ57_18115, partial [Abitibacteriaceae bacterium]|nr:hypothetical protein [Abditibacteriaceae bacterium]
MIHQSSRGAWPGPSFREFSGVNQSGDAQSRLFDNALSWNRNDISWGNLEPRAGVWQQAELDQWGQRILAFRQRGVSFLPILDYTAQWAADRSARQWEHGNTRWQVQPRDDHKFDVSTFSRQPDGTW